MAFFLIRWRNGQGCLFPHRVKPMTKTALALSIVLLGVVGAGLLIGAENRQILSHCEPIHGRVQCELKILGR
jgi:hypothetical protein